MSDQIDFHATTHGTIVLLTPLTDAAMAFCSERFNEENPRLGEAIPIGTRYAADIMSDLYHTHGFELTLNGRRANAPRNT